MSADKIGHGPLDHPVNIEGTPEYRAYLKAWNAMLAAMTKLGACGIGVAVVFPREGGFFTCSSVANRAPGDRHLICSAMAKEAERWHDKLPRESHDLH
ncbi:MAG: hypothetical protein ACREDH_12160 [Methylocella sp.]